MAKARLDSKEEREEILSRTMPVCPECKNWNVGTETCRAFQENIPNEIFIKGNPHIEPFPGDRGIHFEPLEEEPK